MDDYDSDEMVEMARRFFRQLPEDEQVTYLNRLCEIVNRRSHVSDLPKEAS